MASAVRWNQADVEKQLTLFKVNQNYSIND